MWKPVYAKYKGFFDCAQNLQPIISDMIKSPIRGTLLHITGRMGAAFVNSLGALLTLVLNGYGHDAMKIARSLFEIELNILRLNTHPDELQDFLDFNVIQQKQLYDQFSEEQKAQMPKAQYEEMMKSYSAVLPRFVSTRDGTVPRSDWCRDSLYKRAKEAGPDHLYLYHTFYRHASSIHHVDISGIISHLDEGLNADMAPSWSYLDDALVATGCVLRSVGYFDEMAQLGLRERLQSGPNEDYRKACKSLA